jgi:hypothetical protein
MRSLLLSLAGFCFLVACRQTAEKPVKATSHFSYFELSYHSGWGAKGISFIVDSSRIFILPQFLQSIDGNNVTYGLLPDSIYQTIDTIAREIKNYRSQDPDSIYCYDCDEISVMIVNNKDTVRLYQAGDIAPILYRAIDSMKALKDRNGFNQFTVAYFFLETQTDVIEPPKVITE